MDIKILGTGCKKCRELESVAYEAVRELGLDITIEKVQKMNEITSYNVLVTPGLVVNGKVKVSGRVPKFKDIIGFIREEI